MLQPGSLPLSQGRPLLTSYGQALISYCGMPLLKSCPLSLILHILDPLCVRGEENFNVLICSLLNPGDSPHFLFLYDNVHTEAHVGCIDMRSAAAGLPASTNYLLVGYYLAAGLCVGFSYIRLRSVCPL